MVKIIKHSILLKYVCVSIFGLFINFSIASDLPVKVSCNELNECTCERIDFKPLEIEKIIEKIKSKTITDSVLIACYYHQIAFDYDYNFNDFLESINYNKKAEIIRLRKNDGLLWKTYLNLGLNFFNLYEYNQAISFLKKAIDTEGEKKSSDNIKIYTNLAESYLNIGEIETALTQATQSTKILADSTSNIASLYVLSLVLLNKGDSISVEESIKYAKESLHLSQLLDDTISIQYALNNIALAHERIYNFDKAIRYYKQAFEIAKQDTINSATLLNNIAAVQTNQKLYDLSTKTLDKCLFLYKEYYGSEVNYDYSSAYENLADNYIALQQFDGALLHYQKALINLTNNFRNEDIYQNPNPKDTSLFVYSNPDMIRVLHLKASSAYQYYQENNNLQYLTLANQTYQTTFNFHDQLQKDISTENSRLFQVKNIVLFIENALKVAYQQQQNEQNVSETAFRFMEKNKATVLLQSMNETDALKYANLPDGLLEQEKELKIAITFHQKQLNETIEYEDTTKIEQLDKILFEEKQQYHKLIGDLEKNHPKYFRLKYQQNQTQLADVKNQLDDKTALLSYFVGDSSIYTILVLKNSTQLFKKQKPAKWDEIINIFQETITLSNPEERFNKYNKKSFAKFVNNAQSLFQHLLQEPLEGLNTISHLKILPDAELNYIPFDLLLTKSVDTSSVNYKNLPYLLKQKTISYAYSAALMVEQQKTDTTEKDYGYGGYAPKYNDSNNSDLPKARQLVKNMASFFKGKVNINEEATKANFLKDTLDYQILHLAMHGKLNDQYPLNSHLLFSKNKKEIKEDDYKLYASDLYLHELNADLTILNACETGTGELRKGEGVMSLSRAFTYAGCPSLMMSLWSIDENPSARILEIFLKSVKKGNQKDKALQQAKLDYLDNTSTIYSHPYYWAGLVLTGNTEAMEFKSTLSGLWWALGLFFVFFGGGFAIKSYQIKF